MLLGGRVRNGLSWYFFRRGHGQGEFFICHCSSSSMVRIISHGPIMKMRPIVLFGQQTNNPTKAQEVEERQKMRANVTAVVDALITTKWTMHTSIQKNYSPINTNITQWHILGTCSSAGLRNGWSSEGDGLPCTCTELNNEESCHALLLLLMMMMFRDATAFIVLLLLLLPLNHLLLLHRHQLISTRWMSFDSPEHNYGTD